MRFPILVLIVTMIVGVSGCRELGGDKLYAIHLDRPPVESTWERALPRLISVRGGDLHRLKKLADVDSDTVHTTTASCHHGSTLPDPVEVDLRAFYTDQSIFLRLSWHDATMDDSFMRWLFNGVAWANQGGLEDGFGIMFDAQGTFPRFSCSYACHIDDFGVSGANFHAQNKMRLARNGAWTDLWHWKAERTGRYGFADDRFIDYEGMHGDEPGELFKVNSRYAIANREPFGEGDEPLYDLQGESVKGRYYPPGSPAPGYLTEVPQGGRGDVVCRSEHKDGRWVVTLQRKLRTGDPHDVIFVPGDEAGVAFGLAIMDHTLNQHYASRTYERLVLLAAQ